MEEELRLHKKGLEKAKSKKFKFHLFVKKGKYMEGQVHSFRVFIAQVEKMWRN